MDGVLAAASTSCRVDEQKQQSEHELLSDSRTEEPKGVNWLHRYGFLVASNVFVAVSFAGAGGNRRYADRALTKIILR